MNKTVLKLFQQSRIRIGIFLVLLLAGFIVFDGKGGMNVNAADAPKTEEKSDKEEKKADDAAKPADAAAAQPAEQPAAGEPGKSPMKFDPKDPRNPIYLGAFGDERSTGNTSISGYAGEAARLGKGWHAKGIDFEDLPKDKFGLVNWVELANQGIIEPQGIFPGTDKKENPVLNLNILFKMKGGFVDNVLFPHDLHTFWLDCTNCHNEIFFQFAGWNEVKMQEIVQGEWCGRCHGKVAFPISDCTRCHRYPPGDDVEKAKTTTHRRPKPK